MFTLTLQDLVDYTARGEITLESCLYGLISLMQSAIQNALQTHQVANHRATARNLRQALRCVNPILRFGGEDPAALGDALKLIRATLGLAETEAQRAREDARDSSAFVGVAISCQIFLGRIVQRQAKLAAAQATSQVAASQTTTPKEAAGVMPAATRPSFAASDAPTAPRRDVPAAPTPAHAPMTQRAKWLADQRRRKDRKRASA